MKLPISLVIITLNEEKNIKRCIESVPWVNEVIVLDSFSKDRTCKIAESLGATVTQLDWQGYGPQKAAAVKIAKNDWILSLDADEALSNELSAEISKNFAKLNPKVGYKIPRVSYHLGRWIFHGGWYPDYQLRLFNRQYSNWSPSEIHERVISDASKKLKHPIMHWVFENLSDQVMTNDKYSSVQSRDLIEKDLPFSTFNLVTKPLVKFVECYFLKRGFLDGMPGFIIAVSAGYSVFLKWAKLWEYRNTK